jgi:hypothetical protein
MNKRQGERVHHWMSAVALDNLPALHSLVTGLRRDLAAVTAGLSMTWSSGAVEGTVNKIRTSGGRCTAEPASRCSASEYSSTLNSTVTRSSTEPRIPLL